MTGESEKILNEKAEPCDQHNRLFQRGYIELYHGD